ncbi:hypothetical protein BCR34DRAFT_102530 [Clohesyomyces aquaticus]|uniref:Uncharacterized protein n=1 Tax=Clohesyomyces aquaticus TaxID=1231657 RepID=A0A1Y1YT15_9PLEO|nr:hypothetical protein BCR34DRAFT_102530 [Clohesyomyces aquaticus]
MSIVAYFFVPSHASRKAITLQDPTIRLTLASTATRINMATQELEVQPVQDLLLLDEVEEISSDDAIPEHKSGTRIDPNDLMAPPKFEIGDAVHMSTNINGFLTRGDFSINNSRYRKSKKYWEYQLEQSKGVLYENGAWVREKDLKKQSRRR